LLRGDGPWKDEGERPILTQAAGVMRHNPNSVPVTMGKKLLSATKYSSVPAFGQATRGSRKEDRGRYRIGDKGPTHWTPAFDFDSFKIFCSSGGPFLQRSIKASCFPKSAFN